ncbi:exonuclease V [Hyperolius riggenbachi]|uniref:exonuclease V n=1 Tax=Hyperolius riggenbachi TaxID=752182 RepID=UPI0035A2A538
MSGGGAPQGAGSGGEGCTCVADEEGCRLEEDGGSGFSDISDSELLSLQDAAESGDTCSAKKEGLEIIHDNCGKSDVSTGAEQGHHSHHMGLNSAENPVPSDSAQRKRKQKSPTPLEKYSMKHLAVTDICNQIWCEQQMVYKIEQPTVHRPESRAIINEGSSIHLARELEVHDVVPVTTQSREDSWALKCLNILAMIPVLQSGGRIREFPVFRELDGIMVVGVIDELGYSSKGELELRELKTRATPTLPRLAQKKSHELQVCLYKLLFDGMVSGVLQADAVMQHENLRPEQELGADVKEHAIKCGLTVTTLRDVLELTFLNLTFSELPRIDSLKLEYCYQGDSSFLGFDTVTFKEESVMEQVTFYLSYWKGQRDIQGVDIEDAWKCRMCDFADICEWRRNTPRLYRTMTKRFK